MYFRNYKSRKKWQKIFINDVFKHKTKNNDTFSKIVINKTELLKGKGDLLPKSLFKFYSPTSENIIDIKKQRLWLSHPRNFNDPFDCHIGYDVKSYEKHALLKYIKKIGLVDAQHCHDGFTVDEYERLSKSNTSYDYNWYSKIEEYDTLLRELLKNKSKDFDKLIYDLTSKSRNAVKVKIGKLRDINIRVACFSALDRQKNFNDIIHIWSHYADNHKGFCVEYDMSSLQEPIRFSLENYEFHKDQPKYMEERVKALILGGLFPVIYTASRINIPKTKFDKIKFDDIEGLHHDSDIDRLLYKTFIVKSAKWSYEKEWRLILDGDICNYYDNKVPFPYIKRIFLGCKVNTQITDLMLEIAEELGVEVVMMQMDDEKFRIEERGADFYKWDRERNKWYNPLY